MALVDGLQRRARRDAVAHHPEVRDASSEITVELIFRHTARRGHDTVHAFEPVGLAGREILEHEGRTLDGAQGRSASTRIFFSRNRWDAKEGPRAFAEKRKPVWKTKRR
jgi:hypothetical protein